MLIQNPAPQTRIIAASAGALSHTGNTDETVLATVVIPAGAMGLNGMLRITSLWAHPNSANNKTGRIRLGGAAGTAFMAVVSTTTVILQQMTIIRNINAANVQKGYFAAGIGGFAATSGAAVTGAIDTSAAQDLVFTAQLASAAETITLDSYLVELLVP